MKIGVIIFHSNINNLYKKSWIDKSVNSILNQTIKNYTFYEINYDGGDFSVLNDFKNVQKKFWSHKLKNYAEAMNFIIKKCLDDGCDIIFNTNLDDYYHHNRFEKQIETITKENCDIVSSNFHYIREKENDDEITHSLEMHTSENNIKQNFLDGRNVVGHPVVAFNKSFFRDGVMYDIDKVPEEDFDLWKKKLNSGFKFKIISDYLLFYRIHDKQVSNKK